LPPSRQHEPARQTAMSEVHARMPLFDDVSIYHSLHRCWFLLSLCVFIGFLLLLFGFFFLFVFF
jgi:vacuolar-type H+-ATPase subunit I/STV1